jgi:hypothetical protein
MRVVVLALLAVAGCAGPDILARPDDGYRALKVTQSLRAPGPLGNFELSPGLTLVGDRSKAGETLYCGIVQFRDLMAFPTPTCATYSGGMLTMNAEKGLPSRAIAVPPGAIEEIRLR